MKKCLKCKIQQPFSAFYSKKDSKDGHHSNCKSCHNKLRKERYQKNKAKELAKNKKYANKNKEIIKAYQKEYREENKEKKNEQVKQWHKNNKKYQSLKMKDWYQRNQEEVKERVKKYQKENRHINNAAFKRYKSAKLQAVPEWFEKDKVNMIYQKAKELDFHVDHIVPLQSEKVCGLHCWDNLQILSASINCSKSNVFWPDMWE